ncbi:MAG TPA: neutral zinc metallopeptidase [Labilithrix sp.]|nr:neutral zinc metallopeptidase [Labilithrix sp.]
MRWDQGHESPDVIDRRGAGGGGGGGLGGLLALAPLLMRHPVGVVIVLVILGGSLLFGGMFGTQGADAPQVAQTTGANVTPDDDRHFVSFVLDDAQKTWQTVFAKGGRQYRNAKLVLFSGATSTSCGYGQAATGPFYCPTDERVYIDLSFYDELAQRFGAKGDFAQAYVIAHEIGHHVQNQLGASAAVRGLRRSQREGEAGASVRLELQADCFAGIWANSTQARGLLEPGDIDEALTAASAIGDDRLQKAAKGTVSPESFTHGTAEQRSRWFRTGYQLGVVDACDTFRASTL